MPPEKAGAKGARSNAVRSSAKRAQRPDDDDGQDTSAEDNRRRNAYDMTDSDDNEQTQPTLPKKRTAASAQVRPKKRQRMEDDSDEQQSAPSTKKSGQGKAGKSKEARTCLIEGSPWEQYEEFWLKQDISGSVKAYLDKHHPIDENKLDEILPKTPLFDQDWDETKESKFIKEWKKDPIRKRLLAYFDNFPDECLKFWKICVRLYKCSPLQLISDKNHLGYDDSLNDHVRGGSTNERLLGWTTFFYRDLGQLAFHPLFQDNVQLLITALQYAVIVRTKDCRDWPLKNPTGEHFFTIFMEVIQESKCGNLQLPQLHKFARDRLKSRGIAVCTYSRFLRELEVVADDKKVAISGEGGSTNTSYLVNVTDLTNIMRALDATHASFMGGLPQFGLTAKLYGNYGIKGKTPTAEIPNIDTIPEYYERDFLAIRRQEEKEKYRKQRLENTSTPASSLRKPTDSPEPTEVAISMSELRELREKAAKYDDAKKKSSVSAERSGA